RRRRPRPSLPSVSLSSSSISYFNGC
ncbi:hypothetical protein CP533_6644, partial [Ophiocordyceps camponoti-saundersi (nom. inval.)]